MNFEKNIDCPQLKIIEPDKKAHILAKFSTDENNKPIELEGMTCDSDELCGVELHPPGGIYPKSNCYFRNNWRDLLP